MKNFIMSETFIGAVFILFLSCPLMFVVYEYNNLKNECIEVSK